MSSGSTKAGGEYPTEMPQVGGLKDFWKWRRSRKTLIKSYEARGETFPPVRRKADPLLRARDDSITWSGHASVITRLDGLTALSDPVWSRRIAVIVKRLSEPGPEWKEVPTPDLVTISHNHYDHLDSGTIMRVKKQTPVAVPRGVGDWFRRRRYKDVHEFEWWQTKDIGGLQVTFVPSQHFSGRTPFDRNKSLFGGWILKGKRASVYHSGDTGYFRGFQEIGERFPNLDVACLPIGAYEPRWFMRPVHTDPDEAGQAFLDTGAAKLLPIHWGAFRLSDEAMDDPPKRIRSFFEQKGLEDRRLLLPELGETHRLGGDNSPLA
jgi:L-ascorbate metabolism protein UlaG (beta-lactamase superfamily)